MRGACIIDNIDIDDLGMLILRGGDNDFLSFPERKPPMQNDWFEYDGLDVDLSEVFFQPKELNVKFNMTCPDTDTFLYNLDELHRILSKSGYRQMYIRDFDRTFSLRYVSCPQFAQRGGLANPAVKSASFTVRFAMDDPLQVITSDNMHPVAPEINPTHVRLNGFDLSNFGIIVQKAYHTALQLPAPKPPLVRTFEKLNGAIADTVKSASQFPDLIISCHMSADSSEEFYTNYDALFNQLTKPEALSIEIPERTYTCYYSKMNNFRKLMPFSVHPRVSFDLVLKRI